MDYYKIMGVARNASTDDIKRAYRRLARKYHPDVSKEADAEARFKEVGEAYSVLKDPEMRKLYDQFGDDWKRVAESGAAQPGGGRQAGAGGAERNADYRAAFEDIFSGAGGGYRGFADEADYRSAFEELFGHRASGGSGRFTGRGEDYEARLPITLERSFTGGHDTLAVQVPRVTAEGRVVREAKTLSVRIPKGVTAGQRLRLSGQGGPGTGDGRAGDLFAVVEFIPHPYFRADGADIYLDLPVTASEAALGATVKVPTLGGPVDLKIPAGAKTDQKLRLRGRGLPAKRPGDQYVNIKLVVSPADTAEKKELYQQLAKLAQENPRAGLGV